MGFTGIIVVTIRYPNTGRAILRNEGNNISQDGKDYYPLHPKL
jgi:hypothetical protein